MIELMPVAWLHARMTQAITNGITYLRLNRDSLICSPVVVVFGSTVASLKESVSRIPRRRRYSRRPGLATADARAIERP